MIWFAVGAIVLWLIVMAILLTPSRTYASAFDRLTRARWRNDKKGLEIMLDHLRSFPDQWSVSREGASFPLNGAKQIYITQDKDKRWEYNLSSFGTTSRPLDGFYGKQFVEQLNAENSRRESQALLRSFYPELDGTLLLK